VRTAIVSALAAGVFLAGIYAALGGGDYDVEAPPDPCNRSAPAERAGLLGTAERVGINALNGSACELGVTRERLVLVLAGEVEPPPALTEEARGEAFRTGLRRAVDEEERAGRLGSTEATILRGAIAIAPVDALLERVFGGG
jgi:hypothetical protein